MSKSQEVTKTPTERAVAQLGEGLDLSMVEAAAGLGNDDLSVADVAMPYLAILQGLSPQANPGDARYVEGATAGMLYDTVAQEVFPGLKPKKETDRPVGLLLVPCYYERKYVEWKTRESGGGWVADYDADSDILNFTMKNDKGKPVMKQTGNLIVETAYHYVLWMNPEEESWGQGVFPMKSTALRYNKKWNNDLVTTKVPGTQIRAPRFLFPYRLTTFAESKNNNTWFSPWLEREPQTVSGPLYAQAKGFAELIASGTLKRGAEPGAVTDGAPAGEEIPF